MSDSGSSIQLEELKKFKQATIYCLKDHPDIGLIESNTSYIPIEAFKEVFYLMSDFVVERKLTTLIFDKRSLKVFHQPSMEWYFVEWKSEVAAHGLVNHFKILPDDLVFCQSVKLGREQINKKYPRAKFRELNIQYASSVEDALKLLGR